MVGHLLLFAKVGQCSFHCILADIWPWVIETDIGTALCAIWCEKDFLTNRMNIVWLPARCPHRWWQQAWEGRDPDLRPRCHQQDPVGEL